MKVKKIIKYLFLCAILFHIGKITKQELFDNRPFKFEKYRSSKEFGDAVKLYFSIGGNVDEMEDDLKQSGAKCHSV